MGCLQDTFTVSSYETRSGKFTAGDRSAGNNLGQGGQPLEKGTLFCNARLPPSAKGNRAAAPVVPAHLARGTTELHTRSRTCSHRFSFLIVGVVLVGGV